MGNVRSTYNAFQLFGKDVEITDDFEKITKSEAIILPGVGAFSDGMSNLHKKGLVSILENEILKNKKPYLGICLGLEFLARKSFEGGETNGLGWISGNIEKINPESSEFKVPHMGWNDTQIINSGGLLYAEIQNPTFYYTHSYYLTLDDDEKNIITSTCDYGGIQIISSIQKENIFATQFHPEKSQSTGIKLIQNFLEVIKK
jgi:imidazole glycerol-phosphate synthase subunit HisH